VAARARRTTGGNRSKASRSLTLREAAGFFYCESLFFFFVNFFVVNS
jgi:hypothetical protein